MHFHVIMVLGCAITTNCVAPGRVYKIWRPETIPHTSSFTFKVKTCGDIHLYVVLKLSDGKFRDFEYVLRGYKGERGFIRYNHKTILHEGRPASLERCRDFQPYWTSWGDGVLSTGTGWTVGQDALMEYNTTIAKLHLIRIAPKMVRVAADYSLDDQNTAFLRRTPRSLYRGRASSVVVTTLSMIRCAASCREEPRCAAISYTRETHQCKLVGPFKSGTMVASEDLLLVTQRY